jgi:Tol biopolymer transport system component
MRRKPLERLPGVAGWLGSATPAPSSSEIAFNGGPAIFVMSADGSEERRLARNAGRPVWSPDGRKIAFIRRSESDP